MVSWLVLGQETNKRASGAYLVVLSDIVNDVRREALMPHEVIHCIDLGPIHGVRLPASRVLLQRRNQTRQNEGHEPIFDQNLSQDRD